MARTSMPRREPDGWQAKRAGSAWGLFFLALVTVAGSEWLSQVIGGAVVGAFVGVEGLAKISATDYDSLNQLTWWSSIIITVIVVGVVVARVRSDLTWREMHGWGEHWGINWWESFWLPVLIGTAVHGLLFFSVMWAAATG